MLRIITNGDTHDGPAYNISLIILIVTRLEWPFPVWLTGFTLVLLRRSWLDFSQCLSLLLCRAVRNRNCDYSTEYK